VSPCSHLQPVCSRAPTPHPRATPSPVERQSQNASPIPPLPLGTPRFHTTASTSEGAEEDDEEDMSLIIDTKRTRTNIPTPIDTIRANCVGMESATEDGEDDESSYGEDATFACDTTHTSDSFARLVEALEQLGDPYSPISSSSLLSSSHISSQSDKEEAMVATTTRSEGEKDKEEEESDIVLFVPPATPFNTRQHTPSSPLVPLPSQTIPLPSSSPSLLPSRPLSPLSSLSPLRPSSSSSQPSATQPLPQVTLSSQPSPGLQSSSEEPLISSHFASPFAPSIISLHRTQPDILTSKGGNLDLKPLSPLSPIKVFALPPKPQPVPLSGGSPSSSSSMAFGPLLGGARSGTGIIEVGGGRRHACSKSLHWKLSGGAGGGTSGIEGRFGVRDADETRRPSMPNTAGVNAALNGHQGHYGREKEAGGGGSGKRMSGAARVLRMVRSSPHLGLGIGGGSGGLGGLRRLSKGRGQ